MVNKLLAQVGPSRLDERVKLGEEGDGPHEVAADDGEDDRGAPEAGLESCQLESIAVTGAGRMREAYTWFSPLGEKNHAATHMAAITTRPIMTLQLRDQC